MFWRKTINIRIYLEKSFKRRYSPVIVEKLCVKRGSYYPSSIIINNIHPQHLGTEFLALYKTLKDKRLEYKRLSKDKSLSEEERDFYKAIQEAFKILINSVFGKLLFDKYWLYDPLAGLRVTINCQLYLLMLIEYLGIKGFNVISANTDGIITKVPKHREEEYKRICKKWEEATSFDLEYTYYTKYARRDINNYLSITDDGIVKSKGDLIYSEYTNISKDPFVLRRGFDKPIIQLALNNYLVDNKPIEETIRNHTDIYDFCTSQKTDKAFTNEYHTLQNNKLHIQDVQQSVRYFISNKGGTLYKKRKEDKIGRDRTIYAGALTAYCVGKQVTLFNDYIEKDISEYDIDYNYYINETQKILDLIIKPQLKLF